MSAAIDQPEASSSRVRLYDADASTSRFDQHRREQGMDDEEEEEEERDRAAFLSRAKEYRRLHGSVQTNTKLLDSLSTFLSTFQQDLSQVSNHIYELQDQSKEIDGRLEARRSVAQPINDLISEIILPPDLVQIIRDTEPGDAWLPAIATLHDKLVAVRARGKVKAAHEIGMVVEGLKAKAVSSIRGFLLSIIKPIRSSVRTNVQVIQSSILLKYQPFFLFLRHHAPKVAAEVQRSYITSARTYYETSFRRYARAMGTIKARNPEKPDLIGVVSSADTATASAADVKGKSTALSRGEIFARLKHAELDGDPVILAYLADEKDQVRPVEALFRSLLIVLLDNASAEFTFIVRFFAPGPTTGSLASTGPQSASELTLPNPRSRMPRQNSISSLASLDRRPSQLDEDRMDSVSEAGDMARERQANGAGFAKLGGVPGNLSKQDFKLLDEIWRQVMGTGVDYCQTFFQSVTEPLAPPTAIPLLIMIRLNDRVLGEVDSRGCVPLEGLCTGLKLSLWPLFRKAMDAHVDSLKKLADAASGSGFQAMLTKTVKDAAVQEVCSRYSTLFCCMVALDDQADQAMIFSSMTRLRSELVRLIAAQANKIKQTAAKVSFVTGLYEEVLAGLKGAPVNPSHPLMLAEVSFFRTRADDAKRQARATT